METKVLIGVDPHKATNAVAVAVLDEHGELLERAEFSADRKSLRARNSGAPTDSLEHLNPDVGE
jgi:hypothetical protein